MVAQRKNTARKSVGGAAKRVQLTLVPERRFRPGSASSRSPSITPVTSTPPPLEVTVEEKGDDMEVDGEDGPLADDVRFLPLDKLGPSS